MKKLWQIVIATLLVASANAVFAQTGNGKIVEQIMKLETEYTEASKKLDAEDSSRFYTPDFMVTARIPPRPVTRAERETRLKDPNFRRGTIESLTNRDVKVRVYNDSTAIATGAWKRVSRDADGKDNSASGRFTHVWVRQNGKWLLAGSHYSPDIDLEKLRAPAAQANRKN